MCTRDQIWDTLILTKKVLDRQNPKEELIKFLNFRVEIGSNLSNFEFRREILAWNVRLQYSQMQLYAKPPPMRNTPNLTSSNSLRNFIFIILMFCLIASKFGEKMKIFLEMFGYTKLWSKLKFTGKIRKKACNGQK